MNLLLECKLGKYFWKEKLPTEFYACLTVPRRAVKLRCPPGLYMCNTGPDVISKLPSFVFLNVFYILCVFYVQFFQPCMCKSKKSTYLKNSFGLNRFVKDKWSGMMSPHKTGDVTDLEIQRMMSTETIGSDLRSPPEGKQGPDGAGFGVADEVEPSLPHSGCPDDFRLVNQAHMLSGDKFVGTLMECQYSCLSQPDCLGVDWNK